MLSLCIIDDVLYTTVSKGFVFRDWVQEVLSILELGAAHYMDIWLVRALIKKDSLILLNNSVYSVPYNLSCMFSAEVIRLLGIAEAVGVCFEVSETKEYTIIVDNEWFKKAKVLLNYKLCELIIICGKKPIVVKCHYWTTPPVFKQDQKKKQSDKSDDNESNKEKNQKEQKETAKLIYTIFTSNSKPLNNIKADKEEIMTLTD
ncbi:hypothetical protein G9A89_018909 [Geosiphon pyriformis]|nr:hypothetical protein G9A89_018909 [Geosiphon pyriformis]